MLLMVAIFWLELFDSSTPTLPPDPHARLVLPAPPLLRVFDDMLNVFSLGRLCPPDLPKYVGLPTSLTQNC
jgi:hypothetical protein